MTERDASASRRAIVTRLARSLGRPLADAVAKRSKRSCVTRLRWLKPVSIRHINDFVLAHRHVAPLRIPLLLRLPRSALRNNAPHRGRHARGVRRFSRVDCPVEARHLLSRTTRLSRVSVASSPPHDYVYCLQALLRSALEVAALASLADLPGDGGAPASAR